MEYIDMLIATNSVTTKPDNITNKADFINNGVDFLYNNPTVTIDIPSGGAVVHNVKVPSSNVEDIMVTFTTKSGVDTQPVRGSPTALPTDHFPTENVVQIEIVFLQTTDNQPPKNVTLSVDACGPPTTAGITEGKIPLHSIAPQRSDRLRFSFNGTETQKSVIEP